MSRLMSVAFTKDVVVERRKTVTRRKGWQFAKVGDRVTLCEKVMGRKAGEPLVRLAEVEIVSVRREGLYLVSTPGELTAEGFPELEWPLFNPKDPAAGAKVFWQRYFEPQGISPLDDVTRIQWRYLDDELPGCPVPNPKRPHETPRHRASLTSSYSSSKCTAEKSTSPPKNARPTADPESPSRSGKTGTTPSRSEPTDLLPP